MDRARQTKPRPLLHGHPPLRRQTHGRGNPQDPNVPNLPRLLFKDQPLIFAGSTPKFLESYELPNVIKFFGLFAAVFIAVRSSIEATRTSIPASSRTSDRSHTPEKESTPGKIRRISICPASVIRSTTAIFR